MSSKTLNQSPPTYPFFENQKNGQVGLCLIDSSVKLGVLSLQKPQPKHLILCMVRWFIFLLCVKKLLTIYCTRPPNLGGFLELSTIKKVQISFVNLCY